MIAALAVVLGVSALNLALGAWWVTALGGVVLLRRRVRFAAALVLLLVTGLGVAGAERGWLDPPQPVSYAADPADRLLELLALSSGPVATGGRLDDSATAVERAALRARLEERRQEEIRYAIVDFEGRAAAAVALSRRVGVLRRQASAEVSALEEAVRRLALTLTSPEFRDLPARHARLHAWLADIEARLVAARDEGEAAGVARALDPAAMAVVSLRAPWEDLARVDAAAWALVRAVTGGGISVIAASTLHYDEARSEVGLEDRYTLVAVPPLQVIRLDAGVLRRDDLGTTASSVLTYAVGDGPTQEVGGRGEILLPAGVSRATVVARRFDRVPVMPLRSALKPIAFRRVRVALAPAPVGEFLVTVALGVGGLPDPTLPVAAPPRRLERITAARYALQHVSLAGSLQTVPGPDAWTVASSGTVGERAREVTLDLVPATVFLRNPPFAWLRAYLYRPNLAATLALTGLAALTAALTSRPRPPAPPARP